MINIKNLLEFLYSFLCGYRFNLIHGMVNLLHLHSILGLRKLFSYNTFKCVKYLYGLRAKL
jgi:hypothetical protein